MESWKIQSSIELIVKVSICVVLLTIVALLLNDTFVMQEKQSDKKLDHYLGWSCKWLKENIDMNMKE